MFSVYYNVCLFIYNIIVMSRMPVIKYRLESRAPYISLPTVIANFTK